MYLNYRNFSLDADETSGKFQCFYSTAGELHETVFIRDGSMYVTCGDKRYELSSYSERHKKITPEPDCLCATIFYSNGPDGSPELELIFRIDAKSLSISMMARGFLHVDGILTWGEEPESSTFSIRLHNEENFLRAACGPAVSPHDNALFDRINDRALEFDSAGQFIVNYDWQAKSYRFKYVNGLDYGRAFTFRVHENFCRDRFNIPYAPICKKHGFSTPPAGWMSWYALQFKTSEETVLENAERLKTIFGQYADRLCLWVDWEWCHDSWSGVGLAGVDAFSPRRDIYPNGLAAIAKAIHDLGLIPALWVGVTNDGQLCQSYQEHPEWILGRKKEWCGQYWLDPTHPEVLQEYIPAVFRQVLDWGFLMIKWDCFSPMLPICDELHDNFHDPSISTDRAVHGLVRAARETIGQEVYMLSCAGETEREICFAMDEFNAARISGDVFSWNNFITFALRRIYRCYAWHNIILYTDADNLILRDEFNTLAQARTRVSFYGLTGLPITMGDDLRELPPERCDLLKRVLPVMDIHPMDIQHKKCGEEYSLLNLFVCREFGLWNVVALTNLKSEPLALSLRLNADLHITDSNGRLFAVYDFWNRKFLGVFGISFLVEIQAFDTMVLRITAVEKFPTIIFSSRHITQGAAELVSITWDKKNGKLRGTADCVPGEAWTIAIYLPEGFKYLRATGPSSISSTSENNVLTVTMISQSRSRINWTLFFCSQNAK